jgi:hypothetical protein
MAFGARRSGARTCVAMLCGALGLAAHETSSAGERGGALAFPVAKVHFEQNATDGDVEVVFRAKGRAAGLASLSVVSPDGRRVIDFAAPDPSTLGMREFAFESPEPPDPTRLKAAYPEGVYRFSGVAADGTELRGESTLRHELPPTAALLRPAAGAREVPVRGLVIAWAAVAKVAGYIVEVEQDELGVHLEATLPPTATSFAVPDGVLRAGTEYELGIGTLSGAGNVSFVETSFTTAE